jgi:hypothetical protein
MCSNWTANYNKQSAPQVELTEKKDWGCTVVPILVEELVSLRRREYPRNNQNHTADSFYRRGRKDLIPAFLNSRTLLVSLQF